MSKTLLLSTILFFLPSQGLCMQASDGDQEKKKLFIDIIAMDKAYYDILSIRGEKLNNKSSTEVIRQAYHGLAKICHSDRNLKGIKDLVSDRNLKEIKDLADEAMKKINAAYDVLKNPEKRKVFDEERLSYQGPKLSSKSMEKMDTYFSWYVLYFDSKEREKIEEIENEFIPIFKEEKRYLGDTDKSAKKEVPTDNSNANVPYLDDKGKSILQRYWEGVPGGGCCILLLEQLIESKSLDKKIIKQSINHPYKGKTLLYQLLEYIVKEPFFKPYAWYFLFDLLRSHDGIVLDVNIHPSDRPMPIELFLKISNRRLRLISFIKEEDPEKLRETIIELFKANNLDTAGVEYIEKWKAECKYKKRLKRAKLHIVTFLYIVFLLSVLDLCLEAPVTKYILKKLKKKKGRAIASRKKPLKIKRAKKPSEIFPIKWTELYG